MKNRENVVVLLNGVWYIVVVEFECISSRILRVKFKFSRVNVYVGMVYIPIEGDEEEREKF